MLEFRLQKDIENGTGYEIHCDTCGQVSLSSHARYCPYCTRDTIANFTAMPIKKERNVFVTFRIDARYVAEVHVRKDSTTADILKKAREAYEAADFGELTDIVKGYPFMIEDENGNYVWEK